LVLLNVDYKAHDHLNIAIYYNYYMARQKKAEELQNLNPIY